MNRRARIMTFCVTWVVERIVVTHLRKPVVGIASGTSDCTLYVVAASSARSSVLELSNQKRHVI